MRDRVTVSKVKHPRYRYRVTYPDGDSRKQIYFKNKTGDKGADKWAEDKRDELEREGAKLGAITDAERRAIHEFREAIQELPQEA